MTNKINIILDNKSMIVDKGTYIMDLLERENISISNECAGNGTCGKCKIIVHGDISELSQLEESNLTLGEFKKNIRLACQTRLFGKSKIQSIKFSDDLQVQASTKEICISNPMYENYGIAIDIGTTTIVAKLLDSEGVIDSISASNPQHVYGADVINRIDKSLQGKNKELQGLIIERINSLINEFKIRNIINKIEAMVITGNTTMLYLLTNSNPENLAFAPFIADKLFGEYINPKDIGLELFEECKVYLPPCISAFVGADITTALLSEGVYSEDDINLLVDIGTNGEIVLSKYGEIYCCSTAAGPAFEGAELTNGVRGIAGAIDHVKIEDDNLVFSTIENKKPVGICGSGIIDILKVASDLKIIDSSGRIKSESDSVVDSGGNLAIKIAEDIFVTQDDIRKIQLAKSAIYSGIKTILKETDIKFEEVDRLYIAGGFGSYINLENSAHIGLIPEELLEKSVSVGNAAVNGAIMILTNQTLINEIEKIQSTNHIELSTNPNFMEYYISGMSF